MLIWFSLAHLCQWFTKGTVICFVQCHVFSHSLPGPCETPSQHFPPLQLVCKNVSLTILFHSSCNSYAISMQSDICMHSHILSQHRDAVRAKEIKKKKLVQQWMLHPQEIFLHALLDTRAIGSPALLFTPSHSRNKITLAIVTIFLSFHLMQKQWMSPFNFLIVYCFIKTWDCMWNVNCAHQYWTNKTADPNAFITCIKFDFVRILRVASIFISREGHITENNTGDNVKQKLNMLQLKKL